MAQDLVIVLRCDACGSTEDVSTYTIGGRSIDVCQADSPEVVSVAALFRDHSREAEAAASGRGAAAADPSLPARYRTCPICGYLAPTRGAVGMHVRMKHETSLRAAEKGAEPFACRCGVELPTFMALTQHVRQAKGPGHGL